jgi:predicted ATPase
MRYLHQISARNVLSLHDVTVDVQELSVLVGPNGAGKTNFLKIIQFLGDTARLDLGPAIEERGGFERLRFRGERKKNSITVGVKAQVTKYSSENATDDYELKFWRAGSVLQRQETFKYKRTQGKGRRITARGGRVDIQDSDEGEQSSREMSGASAVLSTLPRLGKSKGAEQVKEVADLFQTFRVFEVDVQAARTPSPLPATEHEPPPQLAANASNLAQFLSWLKKADGEVFDLLERDVRYVLPGLKKLHFEQVGGSTSAVAVFLEEQGLKGLTPLAAASFGTVRSLALLAMLHDPNPPRLTCVEEIDHGLHPYALDRIVERLRSAKRRTQLLVATHSPAFVNRLDPSELIVCQRDEKTGASLLPAIEPELVREMADEDELNLGELWFSGALGGVP